METRILFVRHGETDWNRERRVQGHTDRPLNENGRAQAEALAAELRDEPIDAVYSSDLMRARDTARIVAAPRGLEVMVLADLRERDFGTWEGLTDTEIRRRFPVESRGRWWGDAETPDEMTERVVGALRRIVDRHRGGRVLVVGHGGPLRALLRHCGVEHDGPVANCHLLRLGSRADVLRVLD